MADLELRAAEPTPAGALPRQRGRPPLLIVSLLERSPRTLAMTRWGPLAGAAVAIAALHGRDNTSLTDYGLGPRLPPLWYAGVLLVVLGTAASLMARRFSGHRAAAYVAALVGTLYGTPILLAAVPRYPWVYKHVGVTRYLSAHGSVDWSIDIYHRWPGFFAGDAFMSWAMGQPDPTSYARWAELLFASINAILIVGIVTTLTGRSRAGWGSAAVLTVSNWVGQSYYSPQALGMALALACYLVVLRHLYVPGAGRMAMVLERIAVRVTRSGANADRAAVPPMRRWPRWQAITVALSLFGVTVATHQLTPFMVIAGMAILVVLGRVRPWWIVVAMIAMALGYLSLHFGHIEGRFGLFSGLNPLANAKHSDVYQSEPMSGKMWNARASWALTAVVVSLALWGAVSMTRRGLARTAVPLAGLAASPIFLLFGQNYGGEATLRVFLFSVPWLAALAFSAMDPHLIGRRRRALLRPALWLVVIVALFVPAGYGQEELVAVKPGEVEASHWFYRHAEAGTVLMLTGPGFPGRSDARYNEFRGPKSDDDPNLLRTEILRHRPLGSSRDVRLAVELISQYSPRGYLCFSDTQTLYARIFRLVPDGSLQSLETALARSGRFRLVFKNNSARIYQLVQG